MRQAFSEVDRLCREAVADGTTPSAVIVAVDEGTVRGRDAWGWAQRQPDTQLATVESIYDLASVTKAIVTSVLAMQAIGRGDLRLDNPVASYLARFAGPGRERITIRHLLSHSGGLPAHRPYFQVAVTSGEVSCDVRDTIIDAAAREPLVYAPGTQSLYTDVGFILLGAVLESLSGERLDVLFERDVARPLSLATTGFVDVTDGGNARARLLAMGTVAATESCLARGRVIVGEVHDLNAFAMGGVAGHAGLFGTAGDVSRIAEALVRAWQGGPAPSLVERDVIRELWKPAGIPNSTWRLGWDGPAPHGSQAGEKLSRAAVGHLGFTGCSLWIDPLRARWIVLLANRIHPHVPQDQRFRAFRAAIHDSIVESFVSR